VGVESDLDEFWRDPAAVLDELARVDAGDPGLLAQLAHGGGAMGAVALALAGVDGAAGEDPVAAHEALRWAAPHEQELEAVGAVSQQDDRGGLARRRHGAVVEPLSGRWPIAGHGVAEPTGGESLPSGG
jgi:hypothetical protein